MAVRMYGQQVKTITRPNDAMNNQAIQSLSWSGLNMRNLRIAGCCINWPSPIATAPRKRLEPRPLRWGGSERQNAHQERSGARTAQG
jgi:hypothetical protein